MNKWQEVRGIKPASADALVSAAWRMQLETNHVIQKMMNSMIATLHRGNDILCIIGTFVNIAEQILIRTNTAIVKWSVDVIRELEVDTIMTFLNI